MIELERQNASEVVGDHGGPSAKDSLINLAFWHSGIFWHSHSGASVKKLRYKYLTWLKSPPLSLNTMSHFSSPIMPVPLVTDSPPIT